MTNQLSLFDDKPNPDIKVHDNHHLTRVRGKVADHIRAFAKRTGDAASWHMEDLHRFVLARESVAPASTDRILRAMRRNGELDYVVLNRKQSLYQFKKVEVQKG